MYFRVFEFEVGINDGIFYSNEQQMRHEEQILKLPFSSVKKRPRLKGKGINLSKFVNKPGNVGF